MVCRGGGQSTIRRQQRNAALNAQRQIQAVINRVTKVQHQIEGIIDKITYRHRDDRNTQKVSESRLGFISRNVTPSDLRIQRARTLDPKNVRSNQVILRHEFRSFVTSIFIYHPFDRNTRIYYDERPIFFRQGTRSVRRATRGSVPRCWKTGGRHSCRGACATGLRQHRGPGPGLRLEPRVLQLPGNARAPLRAVPEFAARSLQARGSLCCPWFGLASARPRLLHAIIMKCTHPIQPCSLAGAGTAGAPHRDTAPHDSRPAGWYR